MTTSEIDNTLLTIAKEHGFTDFSQFINAYSMTYAVDYAAQRLYPKAVSQPEPEQSQKELWAEIIRESRFHDGTPSDLMAFTDHFSRLFTIQRKK